MVLSHLAPEMVRTDRPESRNLWQPIFRTVAVLLRRPCEPEIISHAGPAKQLPAVLTFCRAFWKQIWVEFRIRNLALISDRDGRWRFRWDVARTTHQNGNT